MMTFLQMTNALIALFCFASFAWSIRSFFKCEEKSHFQMQCIQYLGALSILIHIFLMITDHSPLATHKAISVILFTLSGSLFWWTLYANKAQPLTLAYSKDCPIHLNQSGPYQFIRHPFYTAYTLAWTGCLIQNMHHFLVILLIPNLILLVSLYIQAAWQEEQKFLNSSLKRRYQMYQRQTGQFIPNPFKILNNESYNRHMPF